MISIRHGQAAVGIRPIERRPRPGDKLVKARASPIELEPFSCLACFCIQTLNLYFRHMLPSISMLDITYYIRLSLLSPYQWRRYLYIVSYSSLLHSRLTYKQDEALDPVTLKLNIVNPLGILSGVSLLGHH